MYDNLWIWTTVSVWLGISLLYCVYIVWIYKFLNKTPMNEDELCVQLPFRVTIKGATNGFIIRENRAVELIKFPLQPENPSLRLEKMVRLPGFSGLETRVSNHSSPVYSWSYDLCVTATQLVGCYLIASRHSTSVAIAAVLSFRRCGSFFISAGVRDGVAHKYTVRQKKIPCITQTAISQKWLNLSNSFIYW